MSYKSTYKVLVLDDNQLIRFLCEEALNVIGALPLITEHADKAEEILIAERPHLVLCDVNLPDRPGTDIYVIAKSMGIPSYVMSGRPKPDNVLHDEYFQKPELMSNLVGFFSDHKNAFDSRISSD